MGVGSEEGRIWKKIFFQDRFNTETCLSEYIRDSNLEEFKRELKRYGIELHENMTDILKSETEAIVTLAELLTNLGSKMEEGLTIPFGQLEEEIETVKRSITDASENYRSALEAVEMCETNRHFLNLKSEIASCCVQVTDTIQRDNNENDLTILERVIGKFSFRRDYLRESQSKLMSCRSEWAAIDQIADKLAYSLGKIFLSSIKNNNVKAIATSLRMYDNLGKHRESERIFQIAIVKPALIDIFTESNLNSSRRDVDEIYESALNFIEKDMRVLLDVLQDQLYLKGAFNFVNSFWMEVDVRSREGLPYLAAPGNPDLFRRRYQSTWKFLNVIAEKSGTSRAWADPSFRDHIARFNLPVYFEIRFQQIAGHFEKDIVSLTYLDVNSNVDDRIGCKLNVTNYLWESTQRCFDGQVFIGHLADQFVKLSMLLLKRYLKWFDVTLKKDDWPENTEARQLFLMNSLTDLNVVNSLIGSTGGGDVYRVLPPKALHLIPAIVNSNGKAIDETFATLRNELIETKIQQCRNHLQNVSSIPRLYRRTNRNSPRQASDYIVEAVAVFVGFRKKFDSFLTRQQFDEMLDDIANDVAKLYLQSIGEVLRSVCKTEESLRRLKNRNMNVGEESCGNADNISDETKIREQIKLDAIYFVNELYAFNLLKSKKLLDKIKNEFN